MILDIVTCGHPVLREKGALIGPNTLRPDDLRQLATDMIETMYAANGVGLAAQQVGRALMLAVIDVAASEMPSELRLNGKPQDLAAQMPMILLNPKLTHSEGEQISEEGCLSVPEVSTPIRRAALVRVAAQHLDSRPFQLEATGLLARALQHEIDHLNGILFLDRMDPATRASFEGRVKKIQKETLARLKQSARRRREPAPAA